MRNKFHIDIILTGCTIVGLVLQCIPNIPQLINNIVIFVLILALLLWLLFKVYNREVVRRPKMISMGKNILHNVKDSVVLFGGDLSWIDDYSASLIRLADNTKMVQVFFPLAKIKTMNKEIKESFDVKIYELQNKGVKFYSIPEDYGLRCIISDPHAFNDNENLKILVAKRIDSAKNNSNKYRIRQLNYSDYSDRDICKSYFCNYKLMQVSAKDYTVYVA